MSSVENHSGLANVLAMSAVAAMFVAYASSFSVLGSSVYASKFENGVLPAGVDATGGHVAVVVSLGCAAIALALVVVGAAIRLTNTVGAVLLLGAVAALPYLLLQSIAWQLAF